MRLLVLFFIIFILTPLNKQIKRSPASQQQENPNIASKIEEVCESKDKSIIEICFPYYQTKKNLEETSYSFQKKLESSLTPEISALSGFLLKTAFEKRIKFEFKSQFGTPSVSIQDNNTKVEWLIEHNF